MGEAGETIVRGRCACGKRYRIRHAQRDLIVTCPHCGRTILVTQADLKAAAGDISIPLQPEQAEPAEAVLLDEVELRPAAHGSAPGLTGRQVHTHEAAQLADALAQGRHFKYATGRRSPGAPEVPPGPRGSVNTSAFVLDLLLSFAFAGRLRNAAMLAATIAACTLPFLLLHLLPAGFVVLVAIVDFVLGCLVFLFLVQFFWNIMSMTAAGEDGIPVVPAEWDWLDDALKPLVWLVGITLLCCVPAIVASIYVPIGPFYAPIIWAAGLAGSFIWPIAVLSVAMGGSISALRPDWLVRGIVGIGPAYFLAWGLVLGIAAVVVGLVSLDPSGRGWPPVLATVYPALAGGAVLYLDYVLFRTLGLLFRHFRPHLPWRI